MDLQQLNESIDNYFEGKGCQCNARNESECCCDVDWTLKEVYVLRALELEQKTQF